MAILKQTYVSGNLFVTESNSYVSASEFRGPLVGTASWASHSLDAVTASFALNISPDADLFVKSLHVSGNAQVDGDLKVLGNLTYVGVQDLRVKDHIIEINSDESGSAAGSANGAGVIIRNTDAAGDVELIYSSSDDKLHVNKTIAGTIDSASEAAHAVSASRAESAAQADKVANKLTFGTGISKSAATFDGSEAVTIDVNVDTIVNTVVSQSVSASVAEIAEQVRENLTLNFTAEDGTVATPVEYNGSDPKSFSVDLSGLESKEHASASVAHLQDEIDSMTGGAGSIADQINAATASLNGDASADATGTAVSGGVFVLSGVAINEANGKLTSGSATSVEVEKAGEAAKAKAELLGAETDSTASMTLYGIKNYVNAKTGDGVAALSESVATDFSASNAARVALSSSIATTDSAQNDRLSALETASGSAINRLNSIESKTGSYASSASVAEDLTADRLRLSTLESATASYANSASVATVTSASEARIEVLESASAAVVSGYVTTSSFNSYTQSQANVDATQSARLDALETASGSAISRLDTLEAATSSYALSASVATEQLAQDNRLTALETASGSAITRLDALETASATHVTVENFNSYTSSVSTSLSESNARIETLESSSAVLDDKYVQKAGDTMSGDLTMNNAGIIFGNMKIVWNATDGAIEFVANTNE